MYRIYAAYRIYKPDATHTNRKNKNSWAYKISLNQNQRNEKCTRYIFIYRLATEVPVDA